MFIEYLHKKDGVLPAEGLLTSISTRGVGAPTVFKGVWGLGSWEGALGLQSNAFSKIVRNKLKQMRKLWHAQSAKVFDVVEVRLRACWRRWQRARQKPCAAGVRPRHGVCTPRARPAAYSNCRGARARARTAQQRDAPRATRAGCRLTRRFP